MAEVTGGRPSLNKGRGSTLQGKGEPMEGEAFPSSAHPELSSWAVAPRCDLGGAHADQETPSGGSLSISLLSTLFANLRPSGIGARYTW